MIKAVIFDMDGTLVDSEPLWGKSFNTVFKPFGIEFTERHHMAMRGRNTIENIIQLFEEQPWEGPTPDEVHEMVLKEMIGHIEKGIELKPGVHQALQICKRHDFPVAIASGAPMVIIDAVVDAVELREHFGHIYSSQFETHGKPHPGVFIKTAELLGARPIDCLVFEDAPSGVLAAKAAKMTCIAIPTTPDSKEHAFLQTADIVIDSLTEFDEAMLASL